MKRRIFLQMTGSAALGGLLANSVKGSIAAQGAVVNQLVYPLEDGWAHNWLVAGPHLTPIADATYSREVALRVPIMKQHHRDEPLVSAPFVEAASFTVEDASLAWRYYACQDDHQIDLAAWYSNSRFLRVWAYTELYSPDARAVEMNLYSNGPSDVWLNGGHGLRTEEFNYVTPLQHPFTASLAAGNNTLLIRMEMPVSLNMPLSISLRVQESAAGLSVRVPVYTSVVASRQALEAAFLQVYPIRDIYTRQQDVQLVVPQLAQQAGPVQVELYTGNKMLRRMVWNTTQKTRTLTLGRAGELPAGSYRAVFSAEGNRREIPLRVLGETWHSTPAPGTSYEARRLEALKAAASHAGEPLDPKSKTPVNMWNGAALRGEIAKMELGRWQDVHASTLISFIEGVSHVEDGCDFRMVDLLGMQARYGQHPQMPAGIGDAMRKCVLGFRYWADEPGRTSANYFTENHRMAFHVSEVLAGQLYPTDIFTNNNKSGDWHRQHGEQLALEWLYKRGRYGFEEWDANGYLAADMVLLTHLASLAQHQQLKALARAVMDKILFSIAINSFKGSFGSTHGRTAVDYAKDARNEPIACLAYLCWGTGILNEHADETVGMACAHHEAPEVIQAIALDRPSVLWNRERTGLDPVVEKRGLAPVNKVTYKTPDFMLASAQSWRPGESGYQHHIWQATLSPDASVFTTHPTCISENGNRRPNFWMGNQTLPRVAQWKDALITMYRPRTTDWLQWSHAYFPTFAFDEWRLSGDWAFASVGDGYLALRAQNGVKLIEKGKSAMRELRSAGGNNVWICQMGSRATDGSFAAFQQSVQALKVAFGALSVQWTTLRGEQLAFTWDGALYLNGKEQPLTDFQHYETAYARAPWPAETIEIRHGTQQLLLDFREKA